MVLKGLDHKGEGFIQLNEFIEKIGEFDFEKRLDQALIKEISQRFMQANGYAQMFNYQDFLNKVTFEFEKFKTIDYIFLTLQANMTKLNAADLNQLFKKFDTSGGLG